jgi:redox-sensitive bicupin YhaK (pirin superfamily)
MGEREILNVFEGLETMDGAGVRLIRLFGNREARLFDPFLLLDLFGSDDPDLYLPGFPRHPHRGIETVTYMLSGTVRHGDSMGNSGYIGPGDVQWMTAGSGIIHEEMPQPAPLGLRGFQLWVNLPAAEKMRDPAYRGFSAPEIPVQKIPGGEARVIAGTFNGMKGAVQGLERDPVFIDLHLEDEGSVIVDAPQGETAFACVYEGSLALPALPGGEGAEAGLPRCLLFGEGDAVRFKAGREGCSLVFACGRPIREDIAWGGPIVMNTKAELELAFREYDEGTFVKRRAT